MNESGKKRITVVIPVFNEVANVEAAYRRVSDVFAALADRYDLEILFTDNHSDDGTFDIVRGLAATDERVRGVRFARNFGFHRSVLTGYRLASGEAAIQLDCDLQDPPEVIAEFLTVWEQGHDVVVGVRRTRDDGLTLQWARKLFYRLLHGISNDNIVVDSGDFRLIDRSVLDQLKHIDDASPYVRGLTSLLARRQAVVPYDRQPRRAGDSKFSLYRLVGLAVDGLLAHSTVPLRVASYVGLAIAVLTFLLSLVYIIGRLAFSADWPAGFATTTVLILLGTSLNAIFLGIIGEYVGRIYNQIRTRPTTVIESSVNMPR